MNRVIYFSLYVAIGVCLFDSNSYAHPGGDKEVFFQKVLVEVLPLRIHFLTLDGTHDWESQSYSPRRNPAEPKADWTELTADSQGNVYISFKRGRKTGKELLGVLGDSENDCQAKHTVVMYPKAASCVIAKLGVSFVFRETHKHVRHLVAKEWFYLNLFAINGRVYPGWIYRPGAREYIFDSYNLLVKFDDSGKTVFVSDEFESSTHFNSSDGTPIPVVNQDND